MAVTTRRRRLGTYLTKRPPSGAAGQGKVVDLTIESIEVPIGDHVGCGS